MKDFLHLNQSKKKRGEVRKDTLNCKNPRNFFGSCEVFLCSTQSFYRHPQNTPLYTPKIDVPHVALPICPTSTDRRGSRRFNREKCGEWKEAFRVRFVGLSRHIRIGCRCGTCHPRCRDRRRCSSGCCHVGGYPMSIRRWHR